MTSTHPRPWNPTRAFFISTAYIHHPVWRSHHEEPKRGAPAGHHIPRNEGARISLLLPYATSGVSLIAGWGWIGAAPSGAAVDTSHDAAARVRGAARAAADGGVAGPQALPG